ncbi:uncharacterized protein [Haliotis asinina]|uniref:uncharacterized protein n=1 Tax=Haliotis asinina TaxID=109174 RepID=UPI0035325C5A
MFTRLHIQAREDMIRYHVTPAASLWPSLDEEFDCRPLASSPSPSPDPLRVFTPFWARPDHGETLPAPVTITYADYYPVPSDDDSDYWVYEDEDDDSFVEDIHPVRKALKRVAAFFRRVFS